MNDSVQMDCKTRLNNEWEPHTAMDEGMGDRIELSIGSTGNQGIRQEYMNSRFVIYIN